MTRRNNSPRSPKIPSRPYTINIEASALLDIMTRAYQLHSQESFYPRFSSKFLTRYPSFKGDDWDLPNDTFNAMLDRAAREHDFFSTVQPYRFAHRDITFLRQRGACVNVFVPPHLSRHSYDIARRIQILFPRYNGLSPIRTYRKTELRELNTQSDIWVVRSHDLAERLIDDQRPFILADGRENADLTSAFRLTGWNSIGHALRHGLEIYRHKLLDPEQQTLHGRIDTSDAPHRDVWNGYTYVPGNVQIEAAWIARMLDEIEKASSHPDAYFCFRDGTPFNEIEKRTAMFALQADQEDLLRKLEILRSYHDLQFTLTQTHARWKDIVAHRDARLMQSLFHTQDMLRSHPVTGETKRDLISGLELGYTASWTGSDYLALIARHPEEFNQLHLHSNELDESICTGIVAEFTAGVILKERGWTLLTTTDIDTTSLPSYIKQLVNRGYPNNGFIAKWITKERKEEHAELDVLAVDPNGVLQSVEVKTSHIQEPSSRQRKYIAHMRDGGEIYILNAKEIDPDKPIVVSPRIMLMDYQVVARTVDFGGITAPRSLS